MKNVHALLWQSLTTNVQNNSLYNVITITTPDYEGDREPIK